MLWKAIREPAAVLEYQNIKDAVERVLEILEKHLTTNSKALAPSWRLLIKCRKLLKSLRTRGLAHRWPPSRQCFGPIRMSPTIGVGLQRKKVHQYIKLVPVSSLSELEAELSSSSIACTNGDLTRSGGLPL